jgi:hypothetical protein
MVSESMNVYIDRVECKRNPSPENIEQTRDHVKYRVKKLKESQ